jgi:hypothetical protein
MEKTRTLSLSMYGSRLKPMISTAIASKKQIQMHSSTMEHTAAMV